jgi:YD repeat-containing protein
VSTGPQHTPALAAGGEKLYAAWFDYRAGSREIYLAASQDGGYTWSASYQVYGGGGEGESRGLLSEEEEDGPQLEMVLGPHEEIYLLESALVAEEIRLFQVLEQGATWSTTMLNLPHDLDPSLVEHVALGTNGVGTLYLLWEASQWGISTVWVSTSVDQGQTWSAPYEVDSEVTEAGQVQGALAVGETTAYVVTGNTWYQDLTVWRQTVGGSDWVSTTTETDILPVLAAMDNNDRLYVATREYDESGFALYRGVNGAQDLTRYATMSTEYYHELYDLAVEQGTALLLGLESYLFLPSGEALSLYYPYSVRRGAWLGERPLVIGAHSNPEVDSDVYLHLAIPLPPDQTWATCECPFGCATASQNWAGGPINTRTGNYHYRETDVSLPGLAGALHFERSYNAQAADLYTQTLGPGWTHTYAQRLYFPDDAGGEPGMVIVQGCRGSRFRFRERYTPNGVTYEPRPGVWATLTRTATTPYTYTLTGVDQSTYLFDREGRLQAIRSPQGQTLTLRYANDRLLRVGKADSTYALTFTYDTAGRLQTVVDPLSRTVRYGYDAAGDLVTVTDTRGLTWTYSYTGPHLLNELHNPLGQLVERTAYDAYGRAVQQWTPQAPQPLQFTYGVTGTVVLTDALGQAERHRYTGLGTLGEEQAGVLTETRTYDAHLNWRSTTDARGHTTQYDSATGRDRHAGAPNADDVRRPSSTDGLHRHRRTHHALRLR